MPDDIFSQPPRRPKRRFVPILFFGAWFLSCVVLWLHSTGLITLLQRTDPVRVDRIVARDIGASRLYSYRFTGVDEGASELPYALALLENGRPVLSAATPEEVIDAPSAAFSYSDGQLLFSSADKSDPRANGKRYEIRYTPWTKLRHQKQYLFLFFLGAAILLVYIRRAPLVAAVRGLRRSRQFVPLPWVSDRAYPMIVAVSIVAGTFFVMLVPATFDLGFCGDDWNHIFMRMPGTGLIPDFMASWLFYLSLNRPTPLQALSLATLHEMFGTDPGGYFLSVYAAMAVCAVLIGIVVWKFIGNSLAALAAAIAWLVLPIKSQALYHVSAGAGKWQGSIYIVLSVLFYFLSLTRPARRRWAVSSAVLFVFAMLCYEQAVAILPAFLIVEWFWSRRKFPTRLILGWFWLHVLLTACYVFVRTSLLDANNSEAYHVETKIGASPWAWLLSLAHSDEVQWYIGHYKRSFSMLSWEDLQRSNAIGLFASVLLAGGFLFRFQKPRDQDSERPSLRKSCAAHAGFALLGLTLFVAPQAFLLLVSTWPDERMLVFSSIGLAFLAGQAVGLLNFVLLALRFRPVVRCGQVLLIVALAAGAACMGGKVIRDGIPYAEAGAITRSVHAELRKAAGTIRPDQQVTILGTPWLMRNRGWVFTADYAVMGCVRSALRRPVFPVWVHGRMAILPDVRRYDGFLLLQSHPDMAAFVHNYFTAKDRLAPQSPWSDYDKLALFAFNGRQLKRVNRLHFQDITGAWHEQTLADIPTGIDFHLPRVAKLVESADLLPSACPVHLRLPSVELVSFGMVREPDLMNTYHVQLVWKKLRPEALRELTRLYVYFISPAEEGLWYYAFSLSDKELSRELEDLEWTDDRLLQQDFLINETAGATTEDWCSRVGRVRFLLQSLPADGQPPSAQVEQSWNLRYDLTIVLNQEGPHDR